MSVLSTADTRRRTAPSRWRGRLSRRVEAGRRPRLSSAPGGAGGSTCPPGSRLRDERGVALVLTLMTLLLLTALGLALVLTTSTETVISANYRDGREALFAADAGLARAMQDLLTVPDWNTVLQGTVTSGFVHGPSSGSRALPDGSTLDPMEVANLANCAKVGSCSAGEMDTSTRERPWGPNNPRYQVYAYGPITSMLPVATIDSKFYVVVLVADDPSETDDDPLRDGSTADNPGTGVLQLRAEAFGPGGAHAVIESTVARTSSAELERGYTGQRGQDEQNRRVRKSPVQTPGLGLNRSEMSLGGFMTSVSLRTRKVLRGVYAAL